MAVPKTGSLPGFEITGRDETNPKIGYGGQIWVHVTGDSTGGAFGMWEGLLPPGGSSPVHIHHNEVECIYVMEGTLQFLCDENVWDSSPGTWVMMPKGVRHGIKAVGETPVRFLEFFLPAGLEQLFNKLPDGAMAGTPDIAKILAVAKSYGLEFLGPMPD